MKKIVATLLCVLMLFSVLVACDTSSASTPTTATTPNSGASGDGTPSTIAPLTVATFKTYRIIYAEKMSKEVGNAVADLVSAVKNKFGVTLEKRDDYVNANNPKYQEVDCEIIVGDCKRTACDAIYTTQNLRADDYGYKMEGHKLMLYGGTDAAVVKAVKAFIDNVVKNADTSDTAVLYDNKSDALLYGGTYAVDNLTINGTNISEYRIVYPNTDYCYEEEIATALQAQITALTGYILPLEKDKTAFNGEKEIRIGRTNRDYDYISGLAVADNRYFVRALDGEQILMYAPTPEGMVFASKEFLSKFDASQATAKILALTVNKTETTQVFSVEKLRVMSFNLWVSEVTSERKARVKKVIETYTPDLLGVQEASYNVWMPYLKDNLNANYACVGTGRDSNGTGEYSAIFYKKDKFTLLNSGTKWLSDTPDKVSKYPDSQCNRIFTYAFLKEKSSGEEILYINTHLDHMGAREAQSLVLKNFIQKYIAQYTVIVTGDFNCSSAEEPYSNIVSAGLDNAASIAARSDAVPTFVGGGNAIDYIFISKDDAYVTHYRVATEKVNGGDASDHYPIYADFFWKK